MIITAMLDAAQDAVRQLREAIINVKPAGFAGGYSHQIFTFEITGDKHKNGKFLGALKGRNEDLCLGFSVEADKGIAARVFLDGDAYEIK